MFVTVVAIVIAFGSPTSLASAYGVAVTGTFILDTILFLRSPSCSGARAERLIAFGAAVFLTVDVAFFSSNLTKIIHGGWLPLAIAAIVFTVLMTWRKGRAIVTANRTRAEGPLREFVEQIGEDYPVRRVAAPACFLNPGLQTIPLALRSNIEHNHCVHEHVVIVSVEFERVPYVLESERLRPEPKIMFSSATGDPLDIAAERISRITLRFGFLDAARHPRRAGARRPARAARCRHRSRRGFLLPLADHDRPDRCARAQRLAQEAVRRDGAQRRQPGAVLPPPRQPHRHDERTRRSLRAKAGRRRPDATR